MRKRAVGDAVPASVVAKQDDRPAARDIRQIRVCLTAIGMEINELKERLRSLEKLEVQDAPEVK